MPFSSERLRVLAASDRGRTVAAAMAVAIAATLLQATRVWENLDDLLYDAFIVAGAPHPVRPSDVVVVGIDEPSFSEVGLQWPWPREIHARLLDRLTQAGASVVAFDVVFSEPSPRPDADVALARAIRSSGPVVLAGDVVASEATQFRELQRIDPLPLFREAGALTGIASIEVGRDQVVRQFPQDPDSLWRVALDHHLKRTGKVGYSMTAPGAQVRVRYSDLSDVGYVSYYQALDPAQFLPTDTFRGKIAVVGFVLKTTPEPGRRSADMYATPFLRFSRIYAPGVDLQASFIAAAQAGRVVSPLSQGWTFALAIVLIALGVCVLTRWRAGRATLFTLGAGLGVIGASFGLFELGYWLPVAMPVAVTFGLFGSRGLTAYVDELRRKQQIRRTFELYVAPAVVSEMTEHPEKLVLGGRRQEVTVMFTDLAGFTSLAERLAPEEVATLLNEHLTRMTAAVLLRRGTIDKFIGDSVMAFWGAPLDDPHHALHALQAAVDMQAEMQRWRDEPNGPKQLLMRVGVNSGPVVVGNLGSKARFDYTVIGDAVNLASRLESVNRLYETSILVTEDTALLSSGAIPLRHVDRIRVKGKRNAIEIYTPEEDASIVQTTESAIKAYRAREWQVSADLWRAIIAGRPLDGIASLYLVRVEKNLVNGVPADWDGTVDLDEK